MKPDPHASTSVSSQGADPVVMVKLWCKDFPDALSCCDSCHDDFNLGYDQHLEFDMGGGVVALVCCHVLRWLEEQAALNDGSDAEQESGDL